MGNKALETERNLSVLSEKIEHLGAKIDKDLAANMKDLKASLDKLQQEINAIQKHPEPMIIEKVNSGANDPNEAALKKALYLNRKSENRLSLAWIPTQHLPDCKPLWRPLSYADF